MGRLSHFIRELRRRRVFRVAALYVVCAWGVLGVADLAFPAFDIPENAIRYVWLGTIFGFPIALLFGWRYELTDGQILRTRDAETEANLSLQRTDYIILTALAVVAISITIGLIGQISETQSPSAVYSQVAESDLTRLADDLANRLSVGTQSHEPVSVVIADFQNNTADSDFDRTLEPMIRRALEGAGFITAYDRSRVGALAVPQPSQFDESDARKLAVKQGLGAVLSGSIDLRDNVYTVSVEATETVTNNTITSAQGSTVYKNQVLEVAIKLIARVRNALGDDLSESAQQFAMASLSTTSLDVVRLYAAAMQAAAANNFVESLKFAKEAIEIDPDFGIGYLIASSASSNLQRTDDSRKYNDEALSHLDSMTERERFMVRGSSFWMSGDYEQCVEEFRELTVNYQADVAGRNMLALCLSHLRQMADAMREVGELVKILPSHPVFRINLALYSNYAGEFQKAEQEAQMLEWSDSYTTLSLAFSQLGQGQPTKAKNTYQILGEIDQLGASFSASGLGDLAIYEGRYSDAVEFLRRGAADNLESTSYDAAAAKLVAAARAELSRGHIEAAIDTAEEALRYSTAVKIRFLAARVLIDADDIDGARLLAEGLANELFAEPRAHAKILEAGIALSSGDARQAIILLREANNLFDTWIGLFDLGRASLAAGALVQADSAFDICLNMRRGEALSLFVDEEPTFSFLPEVYYYQGRVREELRNAGFVDSYRAYLSIRGNSIEDAFIREVRERVAR